VAKAREWETAAGGKQTFAVASVRLDTGPFRRPNFPLDSGPGFAQVGDRFSADFAVFTYITFAYKLSVFGDMQKAMLANLPDWVTTDRYAIEARADSISTKDQMRLMMQSLLAERFGLKMHFEERAFPAFAMELASPGKLGPQFRPHAEGPPCDQKRTANGPVKPDEKVFPPECDLFMALDVGPNRMVKLGSRDTTLELMAGALSGFTRPEHAIVDRTGIEGHYDFLLEFLLEPSRAPTAPTDAAGTQRDLQPDLAGPTFLQALKQQLGLKLELMKAEFPVLVTDQIERPNGN
jgi:uncharacterized protein (TIGR03435 family)